MLLVRIAKIVVVLTLIILSFAAVVDSTAGYLPVAASPFTQPLPQVSILFSRSEITAADGKCQADNVNISRLDTTVAPYMASLNLAGTGTVETGPTMQSAEWCAHGRESLAVSWDDATNLSNVYGWTFVSHSATYPTPAQWANMSTAQIFAETCGSEQTILAHNLRGADGLFAWPDNKLASNAFSDIQKCFDTSRVYGSGITTQAQVINSPYRQSTRGLSGGKCEDSSASCSKLATLTRYYSPGTMIDKINKLQPGQWLTMQFYLLVTGTNPSYATNKTRWDCTSSSSADHWTNDAERYCYSDFQQIMQALAAKQTSGEIVVTDPASVAQLFGRTVNP